jgi:hypothetical protein
VNRLFVERSYWHLLQRGVQGGLLEEEEGPDVGDLRSLYCIHEIYCIAFELLDRNFQQMNGASNGYTSLATDASCFRPNSEKHTQCAHLSLRLPHPGTYLTFPDVLAATHAGLEELLQQGEVREKREKREYTKHYTPYTMCECVVCECMVRECMVRECMVGACMMSV